MAPAWGVPPRRLRSCQECTGSPADSLTSVVGMTTIAQALDDLINNHDLPLEIAVDRHFSRVEETTLLLEGAAHDRNLGSAR